MSGARGTCLHALEIPDEWREWGIKRGIVFEKGGAGYSQSACCRGSPDREIATGKPPEQVTDTGADLRQESCGRCSCRTSWVQ